MTTNRWSMHVDWYSYTLATAETNKYWLRDNLVDLFVSEGRSVNIYEADDWDRVPPRRPYQMALRSSKLGCSAYFGGQATVLFEHSGQGCRYLRGIGELDNLISDTKDRCTRIDIACDIHDPISPSDFVAAGYSGNIRTRNDRKSSTGHTITLGSWKSERFVNVYRYYPPHPRHETMRVEFRLKRDYAKNACNWLLAYGPDHVVGMLQKSYKFKHVLWETKKVDTKLPGRPDNKSSEGTLLWVIKQVAPAIRRLVQNGVIDDPRDFFDTHFMPDVKQDTMFRDD